MELREQAVWSQVPMEVKQARRARSVHRVHWKPSRARFQFTLPSSPEPVTVELLLAEYQMRHKPGRLCVASGEAELTNTHPHLPASSQSAILPHTVLTHPC